MKQEYEMLQEEMDKILDINKHASNTVMKIGNVDFSHNLTDAINAYWNILGKKYNFKPRTATASSKGNLFFLAEPCPPPPTLEELENEKYNTVAKIVAEIELCNFKNEAGSIKDFIPFKVLKRKHS